MLVDWEIHATAYRLQDEEMTVEAIVERCAQLGFTHVGIVDHLAPDRGMDVGPLKSISVALEHRRLPAGLKVYRGAEVDITEEGCLPELPRFREQLRLDYVIGSVHAGRHQEETDEQFRSRQFELMVGVLQKPSPIDILGHPWGGRSLDQVPTDMLRDLLRAAASAGVGVELSPRFGAESADLELLIRRTAEEGATLAPASDAHTHEHLGGTAVLHDLMARLGVSEGNLWFPRASVAE